MKLPSTKIDKILGCEAAIILSTILTTATFTSSHVVQRYTTCSCSVLVLVNHWGSCTQGMLTVFPLKMWK